MAGSAGLIPTRGSRLIQAGHISSSHRMKKFSRSCGSRLREMNSGIIVQPKIFYKDRYVKYPFENGLSDLPPDDCFFCISEFIKTLIAVEKGDIPAPTTFRDWIYYTFGKGIAECYMIPYNEKIWKYPADKMSLHWVDGRIPRPLVDDVIKSAIGIPTEGYTHQAVFSYPLKGGIEALVRAIAKPSRGIYPLQFSRFLDPQGTGPLGDQ